MPPKIDIWTNEAEQLLIDLVEVRKILWDITYANYRRTDLKELQWEQVSQKMGAPKYTVEHVKKRWNNMRGTFLDNDRKVRDSKRSGSGTEQIFKPRWPLYPRLQFLKKTISSAQSLSNFSQSVPATQHLSSETQLQSREDYRNFNDTVHSKHIPSEEIPSDSQQIAMFHFDKASKTITFIPEDTQMCSESLQDSFTSSEQDIANSTSLIMSPQSSIISISPLPTPERAASPSIISGKKRIEHKDTLYVKRGASKKKKSESTMEEAVEVIKQIASQPIVLPEYSDRPAQDTVDHFTAYIGAKLKEMSPQHRKLCEEKIIQVIFAS